jgi:hypothetical protein
VYNSLFFIGLNKRKLLLIDEEGEDFDATMTYDDDSGDKDDDEFDEFFKPLDTEELQAYED